jgi:hypothetical protein
MAAARVILRMGWNPFFLANNTPLHERTATGAVSHDLAFK